MYFRTNRVGTLRYRARVAAGEPIRQFTAVPVVGRRRTRPQQWADAVDKLRTLQAEYEAWRDGLPESLAALAMLQLLERVIELQGREKKLQDRVRLLERVILEDKSDEAPQGE